MALFRPSLSRQIEKLMQERQVDALLTTLEHSLQGYAPTKVAEALVLKDEAGRTPAHFAAERGRVECLKIIAELAPGSLGGPDVDLWTPAHRAVYGGHLACLKIIAEHIPESLAAPDKDGRTPAYFSVEQNHADCVTAYREALDLAELLSLRSEAATAAYNLGCAYERIPDIRDLDQAEHWYRRVPSNLSTKPLPRSFFRS